MPFTTPSHLYISFPNRELNQSLETAVFSCPDQLLPSDYLKVKVAQTCLTLCDCMEYAVHGIL